MASLSKSKIIAFRQCPKRLWLEVHKPELREDDPAAKARFAIGHQVGAIAKKLFDPKGQGVEINAQRDGFVSAFEDSQRHLKEERTPIFEAGFSIDGALAFADIMLPHGKKSAWRMIEVKSSTSVKDYHVEDLAVQAYVARTAGVDLKSAELACVDSSWTYPGEEDYQGLLKLTDLTKEALGLAKDVTGWIKQAHEIVERKQEPKVAMGGHCTDPFVCGFCNYCSKGEPQTDFPLEWLPHLSSKKAAAIAARGFADMRDVPDEALNERQVLVKNCTISNKVYFDAKGAQQDLAKHKPPAYFLDFETVSFAVPIWAGTRPYQQIPFQYSLHAIAKDGKLAHSQFLELDGKDPSRRLAESLIARAGRKGPIFVYNEKFEKGRILDLAERFADLSKAFNAIADRLVDLLPVARERYYHPSQKGSWSIKAVLPAAVPEMSYEKLSGVKDGDMASAAYLEAISANTSPDRRSEIYSQLSAYCHLDTLALVRLWEQFTGPTNFIRQTKDIIR